MSLQTQETVAEDKEPQSLRNEQDMIDDDDDYDDYEDYLDDELNDTDLWDNATGG